MENNEIIKALESEIHLAKYVDSSYCDGVNVPLLEVTIDLIDRYRAEIKRLNNEVFAKEQECVDMQEQRDSVKKHLETARAEAIKEFAERLKKIAAQDGAFGYVDCYDIDNLVKEMTEQRKEET